MAGSPRQETYSLEPGKRNAAGSDDVKIAALALGLVAISFLTVAQGKVDLRDEGALWYGAIAVLKGQVPMRDFQSYDPARYYWAAAWLRLLDHGIVPLRIACAAFHFPGLLCGLLVLRRLTHAWAVLVPAGALLTLWLFPPFMLNHTVALVGVWVAVLLIERPTVPRHLLAGVFVGLAAFFGRNLGLYVVVSFSTLILLVWWKTDRRDLVRRVMAWAGGALLGYSPMLVMFLAVPGLWEVYAGAMRWLAEAKSTNLALAVPWPWRASSLWDACLGVFFVLPLLLYALATAWALRARKDDLLRRRVLLAAVLVGLPWVHYAFSRADVQHLGMTLHPFLIGVVALPFAVLPRWRALAVGFVAAVGAASLVVVVSVNPLYVRAVAEPGWYVPVKLGRWTVWTPWYQANFIQGAIHFNESMVRPEEGFLIAPHLGPGLYAILNRDSPVWQNYFIYPHPDWWQRRMIAQLETNHTNWVLLEDVRTDGHEELRFRHTHALMWEYIEREFDPFPVDGLPETFTLFHRRGIPMPPPPERLSGPRLAPGVHAVYGPGLC